MCNSIYIEQWCSYREDISTFFLHAFITRLLSSLSKVPITARFGDLVTLPIGERRRAVGLHSKKLPAPGEQDGGHMEHSLRRAGELIFRHSIFKQDLLILSPVIECLLCRCAKFYHILKVSLL